MSTCPLARPRAGLTLVELILALGLFALLMVAVLQLLDGSLTLWERTETRRDLLELGSAAGELLARDLGGIEGGAEGDLVCTWRRHDANGDGLAAGKWPLLLLKRRATDRERALLREGWPGDLPDSGMLEVAWTVVLAGAQPERVPGVAADPRYETGVLTRAAQLAGDPERVPLFSTGAFDEHGAARFDTDDVAGGVLWLAFTFAGGGAVLEDGWRVGHERDECQLAWDAWGRGRPDGEEHVWNVAPAWVAPAKDVPVLPRRVRFELEVERPRDLRRRPKLAAKVAREDELLVVDSPAKLPEEGALVLIGEEWLRVLAITGRRVSVARAQRETQPGEHAEGAVLHFGERFQRDVDVKLAREEWDL